MFDPQSLIYWTMNPTAEEASRVSDMICKKQVEYLMKTATEAKAADQHAEICLQIYIPELLNRQTTGQGNAKMLRNMDPLCCTVGPNLMWTAAPLCWNIYCTRRSQIFHWCRAELTGINRSWSALLWELHNSVSLCHLETKKERKNTDYWHHTSGEAWWRQHHD